MTARRSFLGVPDRLRRMLGGLGIPLRASTPPPDAPANLGADLAHAAERAARYLHSQIRDDGSFGYRIDAVSGLEDVRRYNVLRHAGSVLALAQHARATGLAAGDVQRLLSSARFLVDHCVRAPRGHSGLLAVWSDPELTGGRRCRSIAKLGGTRPGIGNAART